MKKKIKISKIVLTILFLIILFFAIYKLVNHVTFEKIIFIVLAFVTFLFHIFAWLTPRAFYNLLFKFSRHLPYYCDYDAGYRKLEIRGLGILVFSLIVLSLSFLF